MYYKSTMQALFVLMTLVVPMYALVFENVVVEDCDLSKHYVTGNDTHIWCCDVCPLGYKTTTKCVFNNHSSTVCEKCPNGTFNAFPNQGVDLCLPARVCNATFNIEVMVHTDGTKDTTCKAKAGYWCSTVDNNADCHNAKPHSTKCPVGYQIVKSATAFADIKCGMCPNGYWSANGIYCSPHTQCIDLHTFTIKDGNAYMDNVCGTPLHVYIVGGVFLCAIVSTLLCMHYMIIIMKHKKD